MTELGLFLDKFSLTVENDVECPAEEEDLPHTGLYIALMFEAAPSGEKHTNPHDEPF